MLAKLANMLRQLAFCSQTIVEICKNTLRKKLIHVLYEFVVFFIIDLLYRSVLCLSWMLAWQGLVYEVREATYEVLLLDTDRKKNQI